ncbi:PfkB family carbohydrate kinase, partial [Geodermatophilus sp. SYSU D00742]
MSVTVVGSLNEDVLVRVARLPGRGETVIGSGTALAPGGKGANQAAAAGRLGTGVVMVGRGGGAPAGGRALAARHRGGGDEGPRLRTTPPPTP